MSLLCRRRPATPQSTTWLALALVSYLVLSFVYFGAFVDYRRNILGAGHDPHTAIWLLQWWPWAIAHGLNPLFTHLVWAPDGYNLTWTTSIPALALFGLPLTLLANAVVTFNVLTLLAPALAAWTAFLLAWRLTGHPVAAWTGGYLFGFSAYELAQLIAHLNLDMIFVIPLFVLFSLQRLAGEITRRRYMSLMVTALVVQFGISTEIFATACVFGAMAWVVFLPFVPAEGRRPMWSLAIEIIASATLTAAIVSPYLFFAFKGLSSLPAVINPPDTFSVDPVNLVVPTVAVRLGRHVFSDIAAHFTGNLGEQGAYLGLPLVLVLVSYFASGLSRPSTRALLIILLLLILCSLGPGLWINGIQTHVPLPWKLVDQLPLLRSALPIRFAMYVSLLAGVIAAMWLAEGGPPLMRIVRFSLAGIALLFLLPNQDGLYRWIWTPVPAQPFFQPDNVATVLAPGRNVILLPFGARGPGMFWQWQAGFRFSQAGGYFSFIPAPEAALPAILELANDEPGPSFAADMAALCLSHNVSAIIAGPEISPRLEAALRQLGWAYRYEGGVTVFLVPGLNAAPQSMAGTGAAMTTETITPAR
jgi:hypothetical protein